jgi:GntR family transcriptional regulator / MocR family aminotransferase
MLGQRVVAASMSEGHFARHVKRMRLLCAARRKALAQALSGAFGDDVEVEAGCT